MPKARPMTMDKARIQPRSFDLKVQALSGAWDHPLCFRARCPAGVILRPMEAPGQELVRCIQWIFKPREAGPGVLMVSL